MAVRRGAVGLGLLLIAVAGCGSSSGGSAGTTTSRAAEASTTAVPPSGPVSDPAGAVLPGGGGYPRVIRLEHAGARSGNLLVSVTAEDSTQRFLESDDGGVTFQAVGTIRRDGVLSVHGTGLVELEDGTLLASLAQRFSGTFTPAGVIADQQQAQMDDAVYRSTDGARTWERLSSCARTDRPGEFGGIWEPDLYVDDGGLLHCVWSDETEQPDHSQVLRQAVSDDGGATWSDPEDVVRLPTATQRPGMATTARLDDGSWMMSYEICGEPTFCVVHVRRSADGGRSWGDPSDAGEPVRTDGAVLLFSAPVIAWSPAGGDQGTLMVTSNLAVGPEPQVEPSASTMAVSTDGGTTWSLAPTPLALGQDDGCRRFSSPVVPLDDDGRLFEVKIGRDDAGACATRYGIGTLSG